MDTYVNVLAPKQLLPTTDQQIARVMTLKKLARYQIWSQEDGDSREQRKGRWYPRIVRPSPRTFIECVALNVAVKLANSAFARYASGGKTVASRRIPAAMVIGDIGHEEFMLMTKKYLSRMIRPGNRVIVKHEAGCIYLRVIAQEPIIGKAMDCITVKPL